MFFGNLKRNFKGRKNLALGALPISPLTLTLSQRARE